MHEKGSTTKSPSFIFHDISGQQEENNHDEVESNEGQEIQGDMGACQIENQNEETNAFEIEHHNERVTNLPPRTRQPLSYLRDYHCYATHKNPISMLATQSHFSGKVYPITNFINDNCYSRSHQAYLAATHSTEEPQNYQELVKKPEWQEAMAT